MFQSGWFCSCSWICLLSRSDVSLMCLCSVHPRLAHPVLPHAALLVQLHVPGVSSALFIWFISTKISRQSQTQFSVQSQSSGIILQVITCFPVRRK